MEPNGDSRSKRKGSAEGHSERPLKLLRQENAVSVADDVVSNGGDYLMADSGDDVRLAPVAAAAATDSPEWQATIEKVVKNVVSIHFCQTCSFDTDLSMSSQATGFVVDAERGYILTNRHVACAGPFWGYCIFDNHEEV